MRCPKCGFEQADDIPECGKCGVIIAKALKARQSPAAVSSAPSRRQATTPASFSSQIAAKEKKTEPLITIVASLLLLNAVAWWVNFPRAGKIPEGAYVNVKHQFALAAPQDWLQFTPENVKRIFEENKDRYTGSFRDLIRNSITNPGVEVVFVKAPDSQDDFAPSVNVVIIPLQMPPLSDSEKEKAAEGMIRELKKGLAGYTRESASLIEVDGLTSLEIVGTVPFTFVTQKAEPILGIGAYGRQQVVGYKPEVRKTFTMKLRQLLVPGKKRSYLISYTGDAANSADLDPVFNSTTDSFRVMERPPRFGRITRGVLNGGLFGLCMSLIYLLIKRMSERFPKLRGHKGDDEKIGLS